jgi:hypothetical protein
MTTIFTHSIEVYTSNLVIAGSYDLVIYRRASDALNGEQRRYVPLRAATIAPIERAHQVQSVPYLHVDRNEMILAATLQEATPPNEYAHEEQLRGVVPVAAMFFTPSFVVRATYFKRPDLTLTEALERNSDDFIPLRNIQLFPLISNFPPLQRDFAALAHRYITAFYQLGDATPPAQITPPERPSLLDPPPPPAIEPEEAVAELQTELEAAPDEETNGNPSAQ